MTFTQEHWKKVIEAVQFKARESTAFQFDAMTALTIVRNNWDMLANETQLDAFLNPKKREKLEAEKADHEARLSEINTELNVL
jgi:hypothetical protein